MSLTHFCKLLWKAKSLSKKVPEEKHSAKGLIILNREELLANFGIRRFAHQVPLNSLQIGKAGTQR